MKNIKGLLDSHILLKVEKREKDLTISETSAHEHKVKGLWAHK